MTDFFEMTEFLKGEEQMVKIVETTTFQDGKIETNEKKFSDIHKLYKALSISGLKGDVIYNLKKHGKALIDYDDAKTVIEVVGPKIQLTDLK